MDNKPETLEEYLPRCASLRSKPAWRKGAAKAGRSGCSTVSMRLGGKRGLAILERKKLP